MTPEAPPPPPPPPPPKTLFGGLFKSQVLRRTKRAKSVPENIHSAVQGEVTNTTSVLSEVQSQKLGLNPDFDFSHIKELFKRLDFCINLCPFYRINPSSKLKLSPPRPFSLVFLQFYLERSLDQSFNF